MPHKEMCRGTAAGYFGKCVLYVGSSIRSVSNQVHILGQDILGQDILGQDILGQDILGCSLAFQLYPPPT